MMGKCGSSHNIGTSAMSTSFHNLLLTGIKKLLVMFPIESPRGLLQVSVHVMLRLIHLAVTLCRTKRLVVGLGMLFQELAAVTILMKLVSSSVLHATADKPSNGL